MPDANYAETIRQSLKVLLVRIDTIETYARRHAAEIHEALGEARAVARRNGLPWICVVQNVVTAVFNPKAAVAQALRYLEQADTSASVRGKEVA
ncbi:MAG: hypothetical protein AAGD13_13315 [Pseudomonadota bacterium]